MDHFETVGCISPIHYVLPTNGLSGSPSRRPALNHKSQAAVKDFDKTSSLCVELCIVEASLVYRVNIDLTNYATVAGGEATTLLSLLTLLTLTLLHDVDTFA